MKITETERLFTEEATTGDAPFFFRLLNSPGWLRHIGDRNIKSEIEAENYITEKVIKSYKSNGYGLYVIRLKEPDIVIGICGFVKRDYLPDADLGFALLPEYESMGYMMEAAQSLIDYGFASLSFNNISAITSLANNRSKRLLSKLGFTDEGNIQPGKNQAALQLFSIKASGLL